MFSRRTIILIILVVIVIVFIISKGNDEQNNGTARVKIGDAIFIAEIADEESERNKGLSNRESLGEDNAMLFLFEEKSKYTFWMKGMQFPLDLIWIDGGEVIGVSENLPPDNSINPDVYSPPDEVDKVLEVNAGQVENYNIKAGNKVEILLF